MPSVDALGHPTYDDMLRRILNSKVTVNGGNGSQPPAHGRRPQSLGTPGDVTRDQVAGGGDTPAPTLKMRQVGSIRSASVLGPGGDQVLVYQRVACPEGVGATFQKYLLLQAELDQEHAKRPYLYFLTAGEFWVSWPGGHDSMQMEEVLRRQPFLALPDKLRRLAPQQEYEGVLSATVFGHATWSDLGTCLYQIAGEWNDSGARANEVRVLDDFLEELASRGLWVAPH